MALVPFFGTQTNWGRGNQPSDGEGSLDMRTKRYLLLGIACTIVAVVAGGGAYAHATTSTSAKSKAKSIVFETKVTCCQTAVLGGSNNATLIATSPTLPAGTYFVHATVGVVMGPNDNVICATAPTSVGGNDGIFGTAGNGSTESGHGPNGVYGVATIMDTWTIAQADTIYLYCWVGHFGMGTYASQAVLALEKVGTLIQSP